MYTLVCSHTYTHVHKHVHTRVHSHTHTHGYTLPSSVMRVCMYRGCMPDTFVSSPGPVPFMVSKYFCEHVYTLVHTGVYTNASGICLDACLFIRPYICLYTCPCTGGIGPSYRRVHAHLQTRVYTHVYTHVYTCPYICP